MFCYQCEQASQGTGCTEAGICGKSPDIQSIQDTIRIGLMGLSAYAYHAAEMGARDSQVDAFMHEALFYLGTNVNFDMGRYVKLALKVGEMNLRIMETLDNAYTQRLGNPVPTEVPTGTKAGPGILVSGHDLIDLQELLMQTQGKGINVYTHGEMLPGHAYPELKKYDHLAGNYGGPWQKQKDEFSAFSGPILVTANCVLQPREDYMGRLFTAGLTGAPGATHIEGRNFKPLIDAALSLPPLAARPGRPLMTGFHHTAVLPLAGKIVELVKAGKIKHFFLVAGCDGTRPGRSYYTEFVQSLPKDTVVLTLACGKYRFNYLDLGSIDGIPRLLDMGQCNNAYSAIQVAVALAQAFNCSVNDLPLSLVLSWFEQKAVAILLTLFHLGIKGIRLGPTAPAFISPNVLKVLQDSFDLKLITTPQEDIKAILG